MERLRVGIVPYLNAFPLVRGVDEQLRGAEVVCASPAELGRLLASGEIHLAMLSSIFAGRNPGFCRVGSVCIASRGEVRSVQLFHSTPLKRIRHVGLDPASLSSVALGKIILERHLRLQPEYRDLPPDAEFPMPGLDAAVMMGDRTFAHLDRGVPALDLGRAWRDFTALPFVYAFWTGRENPAWSVVARHLEALRDRNLARLDEVVREAAERWGLTEEFCRNYLTRNVQYFFGPLEEAGLRRFYAEAAALKD